MFTLALAPVPLCVSVVVVVVLVVVLVLGVVPDGLLLTPPVLLCPDGGVWVWLWPAVPATPPVVLGGVLDGGIEVDGVVELGGVGCVCSLAAPVVVVLEELGGVCVAVPVALDVLGVV